MPPGSASIISLFERSIVMRKKESMLTGENGALSMLTSPEKFMPTHRWN